MIERWVFTFIGSLATASVADAMGTPSRCDDGLMHNQCLERTCYAIIPQIYLLQEAVCVTYVVCSFIYV